MTIALVQAVYPHRCPGRLPHGWFQASCAICRWVIEKNVRERARFVYENKEGGRKMAEVGTDALTRDGP